MYVKLGGIQHGTILSWPYLTYQNTQIGQQTEAKKRQINVQRKSPSSMKTEKI
jgi:hypothetical protein